MNRIIPDCVKYMVSNKKVKIRNPNASRRWQHVIEILNGYLKLAKKVSEDKKLNGQSFNFGPKSEQNRTVIDLADDLFKRLKEEMSGDE